MNLGKFVFAQVMEHLPLHVFHRCVVRYSGEHKVKWFSCLDQHLCMAFAQLTYRESLRDIEACLRVQSCEPFWTDKKQSHARACERIRHHRPAPARPAAPGCTPWLRLGPLYSCPAKGESRLAPIKGRSHARESDAPSELDRHRGVVAPRKELEDLGQALRRVAEDIHARVDEL